MTATVIGAKEIAGANSASHVCQVVVYFGGGTADLVQTHRTDRYSWSFATSGAVATSNGVVPGTTLTFTFPATTTLSSVFSGTLTGHRHETIDSWDVNNQQWITDAYDWDQNVSYSPFRLRQFPIDAVAVDSRTTYAPPNKDGSYPAADANADLRNVVFAGWPYRGGLFIGNANGVNGDRSGRARVQLQATDPGGLPGCIFTVSLLHIGTPAFYKQASTQWDGGLSLAAYVPSGVPTANADLAGITWANAMDPATSAACGTLDVTAAASNEYINFPLTSGFPYRLLLKASDETVSRWRYFGGSTYAPPSPTYPYSECKPHLWGCDVPTATGGNLVGPTHTGSGPPIPPYAAESALLSSRAER